MDCQCTGWVGQATHELQTRKEALDKARAIDEALEGRSVEVVSEEIEFHEEGEVAVFPKNKRPDV